jgi:sn-glycerol 3-phosphate transport system substrate-binding protein
MFRLDLKDRQMGLYFRKTAAALLAATMGLTGNAAMAQEKVRVEWWHAMGGRLGEIVDQLITDFNASQDTYEVVGINKGSYAETFAAMIAAYRVGQHPTLVQATERSFLTMLYSGAVVPAGELMAAEGYDIDWDDFVTPVADFYIVDETPAALPFNSSTAILWYNADHFRAAGFDAPADTWQELDEQLYAIKEQGVSDCSMALAGDFIWSMIEGYSAINDYPYATSANGYGGLDTEYIFNTTQVVGQVERMKKWIDDDVLQIAGQGLSPTQLFTSGDCSTFINSTATHAAVESGAEFDWSATFMPHEEGTAEPLNSNIGGAALWVLQGKSDEEQAGAAAFLDFIAKPETQAWWSGETGYVPVTNAAYELMQSQGFFEEHPTREVAILQLTRGEPTENSRGFRFGNSDQTFAVMNEELQSVWTGQKTVQQALDASVERGNQILRQYETLHAGK